MAGLKRLLILIVHTGLLVFLLCATTRAQIPAEAVPPDTSSTLPDSTQSLEPDTTLLDTTLQSDQRPDSTEPKIDSSTVSSGELPVDTLLGKQREEKIIFFNADDSINTYLLNRRMEYSDEMERSFFRDAADLIRYNPSNFIIEYQNTPVRKTLSPFTLPGDRMNVILDDRALHPFEHLYEPDNMIDFNDIPTAPVRNVYNVEGPLGMAYGADNGTSSMILLPYNPDSLLAESKLHVDKGSFGYAYTKALFANRYPNGQLICLALGYRKADGAFSHFDDDAYHQWGKIIYPLNNRTRLNLDGRLYRRRGTFDVQPDNPYVGLFYMDRFRRDRDLAAGLDYAVNDNQKSSLEFRHQRSEASLTRQNRSYRRGFDIFDDSFIFSHEGRLRDYYFKTRLLITQEKYSGYNKKDRYRGLFDARSLYSRGASSWLLYLKAEKVVGYEPAPSGMLYYSLNNKKYYLSGSVGYSTKFPRLYELYLSSRVFRIYNSTEADYYESGNTALKPEKQLIGNITFGWGKVGNDLMLSATGGKISDGIDWQRSDSLPGDTGIIWSSRILGIFRAENKDIEFANFTARQKLSWRRFLHWSGGASYHFVRVNGVTDLPYSPDYQFFSNLELHVYIKKFDLHLYGYGEAIYQQPYHGYLGTEIGDNITLNARLSFRVKKFRFFYIFQNIQANVYELREDYVFPGRYLTYGINWEFLD